MSRRNITTDFIRGSVSNNNNNTDDDDDDDDDVYGAVIVASHFESSPSSYDEYGTATSGRRPSAQAKRPGL